MDNETRERLNKVVHRLKKLSIVKSIILFGSYARDDYNKNSDIDLLVIVNEKNPKQYLGKVIKQISDVNLDGKISPKITNLKDYDVSFLQNVFREGRILYGEPKIIPKELKLKPYRIIFYNLSSLKNTIKVKVSRRVYGYTSIKKIDNTMKSYHYDGLIKNPDIVAQQGAVLLPESEKGFILFLKDNKVPFIEKKVWVE